MTSFIKKLFAALIFVSAMTLRMTVHASSGTEGAAFLDIPVGAGPASMGAAYTALAQDAYAATINPAGLGFTESTQFSGQHLSYLDTLHYEYLSFALPLPRSLSCSSPKDCPGSALGGSVQYLGSGDISGMDDSGNPTGDFSSYYAAYNLAYGRSFNDKLSLGVTGKMISAKLDNVSANAFALDLGGMYKYNTKTTFGATLTNMGSKLKFLSEGDSLPLAFHLGGAYKHNAQWLASSEIVYRKTGLASFHLGGEWQPLKQMALRAGYRTDTLKELSPLAGFSAGLGVSLWASELAYAWLPYGELGNTHYISLLMSFGQVEREKRNLIQYQYEKKRPRTASGDAIAPEYEQLMQMLSESDEKVAAHKDQDTYQELLGILQQ